MDKKLGRFIEVLILFLKMNNKAILLFLVALGLFSCDDTKERNYLQQINESLKSEYELYKRRINNAVKDTEGMNDHVGRRMIHLDSMYQFAAQNIENAELVGLAERALKEFYQNVNNKLEIDIDGSIESLSSNFYQLYGKMKLNLLGKRILDRLALEINAQELKFDELNIFVESNDRDKIAKVYLAAYSSNTEQTFRMYANDKEIEIINGIGQLPLEKNQNKKLYIKVESTINEDYWKDWSMEKVIGK
ncbi:MAG: hypothetical protein ACFB15_25615 [Cyclobacteriaceae bacterium]